MIETWLAAKALFGLARGWWVLIAVAVLAAGIAWLIHAEKADDKANQEIGALQQSNAGLHENAKRTEIGNDAREEIRAPGAVGDRARYDQCLRSARSPENCGRFLPEHAPDNGSAGPGTER